MILKRLVFKRRKPTTYHYMPQYAQMRGSSGGIVHPTHPKLFFSNINCLGHFTAHSDREQKKMLSIVQFALLLSPGPLNESWLLLSLLPLLVWVRCQKPLSRNGRFCYVFCVDFILKLIKIMWFYCPALPHRYLSFIHTH